MTPEIGKWYYVSFGYGVQKGRCVGVLSDSKKSVFEIHFDFREWRDEHPAISNCEALAEIAEEDIPQFKPKESKTAKDVLPVVGIVALVLAIFSMTIVGSLVAALIHKIQ